MSKANEVGGNVPKSNDGFCPVTMMLLEEITTGDKLMFKSPKTGNVYEAGASNTLLVSENTGDLYNISKFKNTLANLAFDSTNARIRMPCECGRKVVSYTRLGEERRVFYACVCGRQWQ